MKTALITGASSGIGYELAKIHASKGGNLVVVARNIDKLNELKSELEKQFGISVYTIKKDLSLVNAALEVYNKTTEKEIQVDYLINNAGFGDYGMFAETSWEKEHQMINLNITALTHLTKLYLKDMMNRKSGKIMNVASTAAFVPGPTMAVYCATKPYVLSFTEALDNEVREFGITVTALCPGATESGFMKAANAQNSSIFKKRKLATSKDVANYGYNAMMKGKTVAIYGFINQALAFFVRLMPRKLVVNVSRKVIQ